jgi:hypothetical protein
MKSHCKKEDKYEEDMKLSFTVVHGQCTDDMLHELKCQQSYERIRMDFDSVRLLKLIQQISYNWRVPSRTYFFRTCRGGARYLAIAQNSKY